MDDLMYTVESPLAAFDQCFKLYQALHSFYPVQSNYSWLFVQQALYGMNTEFDGKIPAVEKHVKGYQKVRI